MKFLNFYQYLAPLILFPLSYLLWLRQFPGQHAFVGLILSIPIVFAYVVPGLGTNWLKVWEFNTRLRLGRFRPQHGFVFGPATSLLTLLCVANLPPQANPLEWLRTAFILGSVLAFWNWLYDIYAIQAGFLIVYNRPHFEKQGPAAIATDYAPVIFGVFGLCYGLTIRLNQYYLLELGRWDYYGWLLLGSNLLALTLPVLAFVGWSYLKNGVSGLRPFSQM